MDDTLNKVREWHKRWTRGAMRDPMPAARPVGFLPVFGAPFVGEKADAPVYLNVAAAPPEGSGESEVTSTKTFRYRTSKSGKWNGRATPVKMRLGDTLRIEFVPPGRRPKTRRRKAQIAQRLARKVTRQHRKHGRKYRHRSWFDRNVSINFGDKAFAHPVPTGFVAFET